MRKTKMFKFPLDAWNQWAERKQKIEERISINTNKKVKVPMTDVIRFYGGRKMYVWDDEVINFFLRKRKRNRQARGVTI